MSDINVKKTKQFLIISIFAITIMVGSLIFFVIKPIAKSVYQIKDDFEADKLKLEIIKEDAAQSHIFVELVDNLGKDQELVENALIKKDSIIVFIQDTEKIAKEVGNEVNISQISTAKVQKATSNETEDAKKLRLEKEAVEKNKVSLALKISGNYKQFLEFLYKLENMTYIFEIESIEIGNSSNRYGAELKATEEAPVDFTVANVIISFTPKDSSNIRK
jgi:hypothetical protein